MKLLAEFDCEYCGKKNFTELLLQSQAAVSKRGTWHRKTTLEQMKEEATKMASTNLHGDFLSLGRDSKIYLSKQFIGRAVCQGMFMKTDVVNKFACCVHKCER